MRGYWFRQSRRTLVDCGPGLRLGRLVDFEIYGSLSIGTDVIISDGASISVRPGATLQIGDGVFVGRNTVVVAAWEVSIGSRTLIAEHCTVRDGDHQASASARDSESQLRLSPVSIGPAVWIGAGARVLRGSTVGEGAVVGANSVVKGNVEADSTVVGAPARPVQRHP